MKRTIRLNENDLTRIVKIVIKENYFDDLPRYHYQRYGGDYNEKIFFVEDAPHYEEFMIAMEAFHKEMMVIKKEIHQNPKLLRNFVIDRLFGKP